VTNADHHTGWTTYSWNRRAPGNDYLKVVRTEPRYMNNTIRIAVTCESSKSCPAAYTLRISTKKAASSLHFASYLATKGPCYINCLDETFNNETRPGLLDPDLELNLLIITTCALSGIFNWSYDLRGCCTPNDMRWMDVCIEPIG